MKEKIEQMAKENFKYKLPTLLLSQDRLSFCVEVGTVYQGSFTIKNSDNSRIKGILYCDDCRLKFSQNKFIGKEIIISFTYHAEYIREQEIQEEIHLITDCKEAILPVHIKITRPLLNSSLGTIMDLNQFVDLARQQWNEALCLFATEGFDRFLCWDAPESVSLYRSLKNGGCMAQAMEEFLCAIHKKRPVVLSMKNKELTYDSLNEDIREEITLSKEQWGYLKAEVFATAPFIEVEKQSITQDDFIHNEYQLFVIIKAKQLKTGIHNAQLIVRTKTQTIELMVKVGKKSLQCNRDRKKKKAIVALMDNYLSFRFHKITQSTYISQAQEILSEYQELEKDSIRFKLYEYHLKISSGTEAERQKLYEELEKELSCGKNVLSDDKAIFAYLNTFSQEYKISSEEACATVSEAIDEKRCQVLLLWCLLNLKKEYEIDSALKYKTIQSAFEQGVYSPLLYYEAYEILVKNVVLMKQFGIFEQNVILLALKYEAMTKSLAVQIIYLAQKEKVCTTQIYQILRAIYEKYHNKEAISCLCSLLIRSGKMELKYHACYELGVSLLLRVAQLPEYYIYTMDERSYQPIHPHLISYFSLNNQLLESKRAYYYACLIQCTKSTEALERYKEEMEYFLEKQLEAGNFNRHLAVLANYLGPHMKLDEKRCKLLSKILFKYLITCDNQQMKAVCVVHRELSEETIVPLVHSLATVDLITDHVELYLIDESGQRYSTNVSYQLTKLVHLEAIYSKIYLLYKNSENLVLHLAQKAQYDQKFDDISLEVRKQALLNQKLSRRTMEELNETLITYYYENHGSEQLKQYLTMVDLLQAVPLQRAKLIELMIVKGLNEMAYAAICRYGWEEISKKRLFRLCENYLRDHKEIKKEEVLIELCHVLLKNNLISVQILKYLSRYYYGTTKEMYEVWKIAREKNVDTEGLEERLLGQMLFAEIKLESADSVFMNYYRGGSNHKLVRAYLGFCAYQYLVFDVSVSQEIFDAMKEETALVKGGVLPLACLKYLSSRKALTEAEKNFAQSWVNYFDQRGTYYPFFKDLAQQIPLPSHITDCYDVKYCCDPTHRVYIHYQLLNEEEKDEQTAQMDQCGYGIHVHRFVLFHSESLRYYIVEETKDGTLIKTEPKILKGKSEENYVRTDLGRINAIIDADENRDEDSLVLLLDAYTKLKYAVGTLIKDINECE